MTVEAVNGFRSGLNGFYCMEADAIRFNSLVGSGERGKGVEAGDNCGGCLRIMTTD